MTAAKVMDIISTLPGCAGQAADAVSAKTQVKMEDALKILKKKNPKSECPDIWIRLPRHKWPKSWSSMEDPVVPLERNLYGHPLAGRLWESQFEKIPLTYGWEKVLNCECLFVQRARGLFLSVYVDDIKMDGKTENLEPTWKILMKDVDLEEPTSFLGYCSELQRYVRIHDFYCSQGKLPTRASGKPDAETISSCSYDMEGHAKKCVDRYCELASKTTQQLYKVAAPCMENHQFK